ncbi:MAG: hypothetical protein RLZZ383_1234 [Pseudomonadota bacterium]|jgi:hypothetical protein
MPYETYKILHLTGLFLAFASLAGLLGVAIAGGDAARVRRPLGAMHGIGLLLAFVAGFGMHAKLKIEGMPTWFLAKIALWLVVGALILIPRRKQEFAWPAWLALPAVGAIGAWLAIAKPF